MTRGQYISAHLIAFLMGLIVGCMWWSYAEASTKCSSDGRGGICCWDTDEEGVLKPISCA